MSLGSDKFNTSLHELKGYLNFNLTISNKRLDINLLNKYDVIICHEDYLKEKKNVDDLKQITKIKILATSSRESNKNFFSSLFSLPIKFEEINNTVENLIAKNNFLKNSSIKIKNYILNKNEKKLLKEESFISLTEKEVQLLELFIQNNQPSNRNKILNEVWKYSEEADTHTVETHIYRLRKKIKSNFNDNNFILNNKNGYSL